MAEPTLAEIAAAQRKNSDDIKQMIRENNSGRSFFSGGGKGFEAIIEDIAGVAQQGVREVATLAEKSMSNTATAADVAHGVTNMLKTLGPGGRMAGEALEFFANVITDTVSNWQKFSHEGLNFAGNAMAFREAVMRTGMSFQDFGDSLDKIKPALFQLGGGINGGMEAFGNISKALNDPLMQVAMSTMGILPKEANEILAMTIRLGRANNINQGPGGIKDLMLSAKSLATEMDSMAKLTGISRREQQKNIETMENDARVRARMTQLMNDPTRREGVGNILTSGAALPPEVQKALAETVATAGIMTSEKVAELNLTYGAPVANQMVRIGQLSEGTAEDQAEAARLTKELFPMMIEGRKQMAQYVRFGANTSPMGMEAFQYQGFQNYENTIARLMKSKADGGEGMEYDAAAKEAGLRAKAQSEGKLIESIEIIVDGQKRMVEATRDARTGEYTKEDPRKFATQLVNTAASVARGIGQEANEGARKLNDKLLEMESFKDEKTGEERFRYTKASAELIAAANGADKDGKNLGNTLGKDISEFITKNTTALTDLPNGIAKAFVGIARGLGYKVDEKNIPSSQSQVRASDNAIDTQNATNYRNQYSSQAPNLSAVISKSADVLAATKETTEKVAALTNKMPDNNLLADHLKEISTLMASVKTSVSETAAYSRKIADQTYGMNNAVT